MENKSSSFSKTSCAVGDDDEADGFESDIVSKMTCNVDEKSDRLGLEFVIICLVFTINLHLPSMLLVYG